MKLTRPIIFFDLETTGTDIVYDRIVQIGAIKMNPDRTQEEKNVLINPTIPIPKEASDVHGITDEMVKNKPKFRQVAKAMFEWFKGCDLGGYNSDNFDLPMLIEEFSRAGIEFPEGEIHLVDVLKIERMVNSHKLEETFKRYTGNSLEDAHDAMADIKATVTVIVHQSEEHDIPDSPKEIDEFLQGETQRVDYAGKIIMQDGVAVWSFGKNRGKPVNTDISYAQWVLSSNFSNDTKKHVRRLITN